MELTTTTEPKEARPMSAVHFHTRDELAGYVVRETVDADGSIITRDPADVWNASELPNYPRLVNVGRDVQRFEGAGAYGAALDLARTFRAGRGYAVVDPVYTDGHRGMA